MFAEDEHQFGIIRVLVLDLGMKQKDENEIFAGNTTLIDTQQGCQ